MANPGANTQMGGEGHGERQPPADAVQTRKASVQEKENCKKGRQKQEGKIDRGVLGPDGKKIKLANCVVNAMKPGRRWGRYKQEFIIKEENKSFIKLPSNCDLGTPSVSYTKKRKDLRDINIIVLHEPLTWDLDIAMVSLTSDCNGVHFSLNRNGKLLAHAYVDDDVNHAKGYHGHSIGMEVINRFSTYNKRGKMYPTMKNIQEPDGKIKVIPTSQNGPNGPIPWKNGDLRTPRSWSGYKGKKYNFILPPEKQMIALYDFVVYSNKQYGIPIRFPGVLLSYELCRGYFWGSFGPSRVKPKVLKPVLNSPRVNIETGGIIAHAHSGSDHTDGIFYQYYLMLRFIEPRMNHKEAFAATIAAADSACNTKPIGGPINYTRKFTRKGKLIPGPALGAGGNVTPLPDYIENNIFEGLAGGSALWTFL